MGINKIQNSVEVDPGDVFLEMPEIQGPQFHTPCSNIKSPQEERDRNRRKMQLVKKKPKIQDPILFSNLQLLLVSSIKGKLKTGERATDIATIMRGTEVFNCLEDLNNDDLLNQENSAIDFGEAPVRIEEGENAPFKVPRTTVSRIVLEYAECQPKLQQNKKFDQSNIISHGITAEDFEYTVSRANEVLLPFRGKATTSVINSMIFIGIGLLVVLILSIILGVLVSAFISLGLIVAAICFLIIYFIWIRKRNARLLVYAHIALALFARCENNRFYLRHRILVRPEYLGKWLEFNMASALSQSAASQIECEEQVCF